MDGNKLVVLYKIPHAQSYRLDVKDALKSEALYSLNF